MQEELARIRNKDYSHLDERLYSNMGMTSELDSTIAQLAELQRYLKSQIDSIEDQGRKEAVMRASKVVMGMGVEDGERDGRRDGRCSCGQKFGAVLEKVRRVNKTFRNIKDIVQRQTRTCIADFTEMINEAFTYLTESSSRKNSQISKLKIQLLTNKQQLTELQTRNTELQQKLQDWQQAQQRRKHKLEQCRKDSTASINKNISTEHHFSTSTRERERERQITSTYLEENSIATDRLVCVEKDFKSLYTVECDQMFTENDCPKLPMPLRRESSAGKVGPSEKYNSCHNSRKELHENNTRIQTAKNSPSNRKAQQQRVSPSKRLRDKENQMLKLKGTDGNNRKSTKKLKLFSLI